MIHANCLGCSSCCSRFPRRLSARFRLRRAGHHIKNPAVLERIEKYRTLIFDKTGTLTYGRPNLSEIICAKDFERAEVLRYAACAEQYSRHPLAIAMVMAAKQENIETLSVDKIREKPGEGLKGRIAGKLIEITGRKKVTDRTLPLPELVNSLECLRFVEG